MKLAWMILLTILISLLPLTGCDGTGGVGGQGISITVHQGATDTAAADPGAPVGECGRNVSNITINIEDGGTLTGNPSVGSGLEQEAEVPSTKPSGQEETPQPSPEVPGPGG